MDIIWLYWLFSVSKVFFYFRVDICFYMVVRVIWMNIDVRKILFMWFLKKWYIFIKLEVDMDFRYYKLFLG